MRKPPIIAALLLLALASCREPVSPIRPPYLAILSKFTIAPGARVSAKLHYSVSELSGTLGIDRLLATNPGDTLILSLPPATYLVELKDLPATCSVRDGARKLIALLDSDNTGTLRFNVSCMPSLTIEAFMDGYELDTELAYRVTGPGIDKVGLINLAGPDSIHTRGDTVSIDGLPGGEYQVSIAHLSPNCVVYGDNTARDRALSLAPSGAAIVSFRVRCSETTNRPTVLSFQSTYHDSTSGFVFRVADPDHDVQSYRWDLTDCHGNSVLPAPDHARVRRGLDAGRTRGADTMTIVGAFEAGIADEELAGKCTSLLVEDFRGNTSDLIEQKIQAHRSGVPPQSTLFDARLIGETSLSTTLGARDSDGDFAGAFVAIRVRDGVLAAFDGQPDIGILSPAGFLDMVIPNVALGGRLHWDDIYAVIAYLVDYNGNFTRLEDSALFP
jgi:hypothetical protein